MDCRSVRELADAFIAEQLLVETTHQVVRHMDSCSACRAEIAARRALRNRLRTAFSRAADLQPRPNFAADMAEALRPDRGVSRRSLLRSWWALAAGVAAAAGGGELLLTARARAQLATLVRQAAGDHQNCAVRFNLAEHSIPLDAAARRFGGLYAALASFSPAIVDPRLDVVARHACVYDGVRFGHVIMQDRNALISLLVAPGVPPPTVRLESTEGGVAVASLPAGRFVAFIVARADAPRVLHLAQAFAAPLSTHLA